MSSANIATREDKSASGRSFTYSRKSAGPSIDPCGTPEFTGRVIEVTSGDPQGSILGPVPSTTKPPVYSPRRLRHPYQAASL